MDSGDIEAIESTESTDEILASGPHEWSVASAEKDVFVPALMRYRKARQHHISRRRLKQWKP